MANHKSAIKRIRQTQVRRLRNSYQHKTVRNAIRDFKTIKDKEKAQEEYKKLTALIDKLAKRKVIHKNKAANKKAELARYMKFISSGQA